MHKLFLELSLTTPDCDPERLIHEIMDRLRNYTSSNHPFCTKIVIRNDLAHPCERCNVKGTTEIVAKSCEGCDGQCGDSPDDCV